jgi:proteasome lid subunit RPN8/RPN11
MFLSACGSESTRSWKSASLVAPGWSPSHYQLSQSESERLQSEARKAREAGNREVCGAILQHPDGSLQLCFADNESKRAHSFLLSPASVQRMQLLAEKAGATIIGSFHSHPSSGPEPGKGDLDGASLGSLMMIHSVRSGETKLWLVIWQDGEKRAREVSLRVYSRRNRSASPLPPSRTNPTPPHPEADARTLAG